jgi:tRNA A-37 threonylcarbamoyl transferase component Bud32
MATKSDRGTTLTVKYGDLRSHAFLWQKAVLLFPLWAVLVVPIFGFVARAMGHSASQMGYSLVICLCLAYFIEDVLKRKIRLDDDYIFHGYRAIPIKQIATVDLIYKKGKLVPTIMSLTLYSGKRVKFTLNALSNDAVESMIRHIQVRNSSLKTATIFPALIKCRQVARTESTGLDRADFLAVPYMSRQWLTESIETFKSTAASWIRLGPLLACVAATPLWITVMWGLFNVAQPRNFEKLKALKGHEFLQQFMSALELLIATLLGNTVKTVAEAAANPWIAFTASGCLLLFVLYVQRVLIKPNWLIADKNGLSLRLKAGEVSVPVSKLKWTDISEARLHKIAKRSGTNSLKIRLVKKNKKHFDIDMTAVAEADRSRLLKQIERHAPQCPIDAELSQSVLPKSERSYTEIWLQSLTEAPRRKALEPLEPGQLVGNERYEILRKVGVGGQGTAYLTRIVGSDNGETVVLKESVIPTFVESTVRKKALKRFEEEAKLLKSVEDDSVVKLIEYFVEDHRAYLVLEYIDGFSLREIVRRDGPLSEEATRDLALQMCDMLALLHDRAIVHRDFTPDNLILNSNGKLKLIDFNVAQQLQGGSSGTIVGKHAYLPPEQFRGKPTSQSDLYAFGATLFYLLTGKDPEPISQSSPLASGISVSEKLDQIIQHATKLQSDKRYQSASEIQNELLAPEPAHVISARTEVLET